MVDGPSPRDGPADALTATRRRGSAPRSRRWRRGKWFAWVTVLAILVGYPTMVGCDSFFYYPGKRIYYNPREFGLKYEDVTFTTRDGVRLHGWFLPATTPARGVVVHFHGNAANVSGHVPLVDWLPHEGYHVLMFDYRGYGRSEGRVTRAGTILDGLAAIDFALSRPEAAGLPLFIYGQSLGGAVGVVVAAERPEVRAVVAESTFSSYRRIAAHHGKNMLLLEPLARFAAWVTISKGHEPIDAVGRLAPRPLLVIAAENDTICFPELARELYDAAGEPKEFWLVPGAEHLGIDLHARSELIARIRGFFERAAK